MVGGFTIGRPGLRRNDVLERALGRAARLSDFGRHCVLVMATDMPAPRSVGARALASARGRVLIDVLPVDADDGAPTAAVEARLRAYAASGGDATPIGDLLAGP